ncbi:cyclic nucleotide-binding domain-containing protein [uncultured Microscilla sp.]|uniref:cyclic nucleotide-binding domain-containing protein n=1 Tax=uncultured Microscilla sp. TaxID=432653 RepID=UPI00261047E4|nr:cyclic nucleotide-binding domain-containing protein [uncultured Microscilla sp.]
MIKPFSKSYTKEQLELFEFLLKNKLFSELTLKELSEFLPHLYLRTYQQNEVIFFRNDPSQALYLIKTGMVALKIDVNDSFETFAHIHPTASVGNNALLNKTKRVYNAIVESESAQLYVIPQVNILSIFDSNVKIRAKLYASLAEIYNSNTTNLMKAYQATSGFFDLEQMYKNLEHGG